METVGGIGVGPGTSAANDVVTVPAFPMVAVGLLTGMVALRNCLREAGYELSDAHLPSHAVTLVDVPAMAISSSTCRERVRGGHPIWYLVPDGVVQYIAKHHLYRNVSSPG